MKFPIKFIIALCVLLIGISGIIVFTVPNYGPEKAVYHFIAAAEKGDVDKMMKCTVLSEASDALDSSYLGSLGESLTAQGPDTMLKNLLSIPEDAGEVTSVKILGSKAEEASIMGVTSQKVTVLIKAIYIDSQSEEQSIITEEAFNLIDTQKGYLIFS